MTIRKPTVTIAAIVVLTAALATLPACRPADEGRPVDQGHPADQDRPADPAAATTAIQSVMHDAETGWNTGDLEAYMDCYWRSDTLRFAGGDKVSYGWEQVLANYRRGYPDRAAMGELTFSDLDITLLAEDAAVCFGRWRLCRATGQSPDDNPHGLFTLVFRRLDGQWRIVHDHTSSAG